MVGGVGVKLWLKIWYFLKKKPFISTCYLLKGTGLWVYVIIWWSQGCTVAEKYVIVKGEVFCVLVNLILLNFDIWGGAFYFSWRKQLNIITFKHGSGWIG